MCVCVYCIHGKGVVHLNKNPSVTGGMWLSPSLGFLLCGLNYPATRCPTANGNCLALRGQDTKIPFGEFYGDHCQWLYHLQLIPLTLTCCLFWASLMPPDPKPPSSLLSALTFPSRSRPPPLRLPARGFFFSNMFLTPTVVLCAPREPLPHYKQRN